MAKTKVKKSVKPAQSGLWKRKIVLPLVAVLLFASAAAYLLARSNAATGIYVSGAFGFNCRTYNPPDLRLGSTGACVKVAQYGLNNWIKYRNQEAGRTIYQLIPVDGIYSTTTRTAVIKYQKFYAYDGVVSSDGSTKYPLKVNGIVGQRTWMHMSQNCVWWTGDGSWCFDDGCDGGKC